MKRIHTFLSLFAAAALVLAACERPQPDPVGPDNPDNPDQGDTTQVTPDPQPETYFGIADAADLTAFADSVNNEKSIERFCINGEVTLLKDIDMSDVATWTPIGNPETLANASTSSTVTGPAFRGSFNGAGHCIFNFTQTVSVPASGTWGLFGVLDGAKVYKLVLGKDDDKSLVKLSASGTADAGILAGTAINGAVIEDCVNNIPLSVLGSSASERFACGVFAGYCCSSDKAVNLTKLTNNAPITMTAGSNTANGSTGVMVGGIAGFCTGSDALTMIESCENTAGIKGDCGRSSGIAATMNAKTMMRYCVNRGSNENSFVNGRVGNLTCIMGSGCSMDDCTNYGDVITSDASTTTAGMIALLNNANVIVTGGGNYGKVIGANEQYHGLLVANFSKFSSVDGCHAGGSCGTYSADGNHKMHELTADNWMSHIGYYSSANLARITGISSSFGTGGGSGAVEQGNLPEFKDASLKILFIGNSFTKDAVEHLPGLINAAGIKDVTMAHCYYGGRTIPEYNDGWSSARDYTLYYMNAGGSSWTTFSDKVTIKDVAESGRWDIVTIQEHTGNYRAWSWTTDEKTAVEGLLDKCVKTQTVAPKAYYVLSQAYYNMAKIGSSSRPYITWTDQAGMYEVIVAQGKKVLDETIVEDILATGTMLQNLRTSGLDNEMNLTRDGYHMDFGVSRYGAACLMFEKLITPKFNIKLDGNSYRFSTESQVDGSYSTPVTDANAPIALKAARYAIETPFSVTDMKGEGGSAGGDTPQEEVTLQGSGTEADPYLISKAEEMKGMAGKLVEGETRYFALTSDIDMSSITDWTPVNTANKAFGLQFDGRNHTISGFTCSGQNYASLFGLVHGGVRNLNMDSPVVSHTGQCAIIATWLGNNSGSLSATVQNVHIKNAKLTTSATDAACLGMIAANAGSSQILDCSATGEIHHSISSGKWTYVGGLVGRVYISGDIERCSYEGTITAAGGFGLAGICAGSAKDIALVIKNCWSDGSISGGSYQGGIVSELCKGSSVINCWSGMSLSGTYNHGGIVAKASNATNPYSSNTFSIDIDITVSGCIAWNASMVSTKQSSETPANHYSSGAIVGFTTYLNKLSNCLRRPDIDFQMYSIANYNTLVDTPDVSPTAPLKKTGSETYYCPYNGQAAASSATVSSLAKTLGWDENIWDLSSDKPKLK